MRDSIVSRAYLPKISEIVAGELTVSREKRFKGPLVAISCLWYVLPEVQLWWFATAGVGSSQESKAQPRGVSGNDATTRVQGSEVAIYAWLVPSGA